jgi:succinate dehydrogenase / fumarate reductase iron-sulfur subunit
MSDERHVTVRVRRQPGRGAPAHWEVFSIARQPAMTVADVLEAIAAEPLTTDGVSVAPVAWASACTWPACGVCAMVINGRARPACATPVAEVAPRRKRLELAPLAGFPVRRDLWVDRSRLRRDAQRLAAGTSDDVGDAAAAMAPFERCTRCGACLDACPETRARGRFAGPYAFGAAYAARLGGGGDRLALLAPGGIAECGHAQNCVEVCPEAVPLGEALGEGARWATRDLWATLFRRR